MKKSKGALQLVSSTPELLTEYVTVTTTFGSCRQLIRRHPSRAGTATQAAMEAAKQVIRAGYSVGPWGYLIKVTFSDMEEYRVRVVNNGDLKDPILVCTYVTVHHLPRAILAGKVVTVVLVGFILGAAVVATLLNISRPWW